MSPELPERNAIVVPPRVQLNDLRAHTHKHTHTHTHTHTPARPPCSEGTVSAGGRFISPWQVRRIFCGSHTRAHATRRGRVRVSLTCCLSSMISSARRSCLATISTTRVAAMVFAEASSNAPTTVQLSQGRSARRGRRVPFCEFA